ncbi:MAG: hypothetical protein C0518_05430 [Opitutus sp.]|nr:hypothetical protein [Opitutus sp.]
MKHFPARCYSAQIGVELADEITRASRGQFWISVAQSLLCGALGLIAGIVLALGYLADLPSWLR